MTNKGCLYVRQTFDGDKFTVFIENQFEDTVHAVCLYDCAQYIGWEADRAAIRRPGHYRAYTACVIAGELLRRQVERDKQTLLHCIDVLAVLYTIPAVDMGAVMAVIHFLMACPASVFPRFQIEPGTLCVSAIV